jgi:SAM domain (Sterile alpha motif)
MGGTYDKLLCLRMGPPMQQIADWLKELDMAESAERFAENHIDSGVLRDLTDQDLKDLGVVSIGHRRKMLPSLLKLARFRPDPHRLPSRSRQ